MILPVQSYIICCTPRSGSHLLAGGLASTGIAGYPAERFPRFSSDNAPLTAAQRDELVTEPPPESSYDTKLDSQYIERIIRFGMTENGVFGINIHWFQLNDAVRRIHAYVGSNELTPRDALSSAFPNLSYVWLRRRDKIAQAVSWYKAIQTGQYVKLQGTSVPEGACQGTIVFDYAKIKSYQSALRSSDNGWEYFFRSNEIQPLVIYYEDLASSYNDSVLSVLQFLKLDAVHISVGRPKYERTADQQSLEWIEKFKMMQSAIKRGAS